MNHERILSKDEVNERTGEAKPAFNVAVVYDDRNAASRAMNVFNGLVHQFGDDFEFRCDLWRFDVLALPTAREAAARAGEAAELIIVSTRGDADLPASVKDWLNWCVDGKSPGSAALVALLESHQRLSDVQCRTRQFLQVATDRNLMDFFLHEGDVPHTSLKLTPKILEERANTVSSVLEGILRRGDPPPRWRAQA